MLIRCVLVLNLMFVIIGTFYTNHLNDEHTTKKSPNPYASKGHAIKYSNGDPVYHVEFNQQAEKIKKRSTFVDRFLSCFCLVKNSSIITTDALGSDSIEVIHGMR